MKSTTTLTSSTLFRYDSNRDGWAETYAALLDWYESEHTGHNVSEGVSPGHTSLYCLKCDKHLLLLDLGQRA